VERSLESLSPRCMEGQGNPSKFGEKGKLSKKTQIYSQNGARTTKVRLPPGKALTEFSEARGGACQGRKG